MATTAQPTLSYKQQDAQRSRSQSPSASSYYNATDDILDFYRESTEQAPYNNEAPRSTTALSLPIMTGNTNRGVQSPAELGASTTNRTGHSLRRSARYQDLRPRPRPLSTGVFDDLDITTIHESDFPNLNNDYPPINPSHTAVKNSAARSGARSTTKESRAGSRISSLPNHKYKHRHSASFGYSDSLNNFSPEGQGRQRPKSMVLDEIEAVRERIQKLKTNSKPGSPTSTNDGQSTYASPQKNGNDNELQDSPIRQGLSNNTSDQANGNTDGEEDEDDDNWDRQEPVSAIMSSPEPWSYGKSGTNSVIGDDRTSSGASPTLTRQSPAEKHLMDVIERARKVRDHDMLVVMLERVVTDTMSLYNHSGGARQNEAIDRVCLSLADFVLKFLDTAEDQYSNNSTLTPQPSRSQFSPRAANATLSTPANSSYVRSRYSTPMNRSASSLNNPHTSGSLWNHQHQDSYHSAGSLSRSASVRPDYASPIPRSQTFNGTSPSLLPSGSRRQLHYPNSNSQANNHRRFDDKRSFF